MGYVSPFFYTFILHFFLFFFVAIMVMSTEIATYAAGIYNTSPTLLPENIASFITAIALATRLSLRCSSLLIEVLMESVKYSTSLSFGISRQAIINALSSAKKLHRISSKALVASTDNVINPENHGFLQILDKYTNLGIYLVHHSFTLAELFTLSGIQFTTQTIKSGLVAAEESVGIIDGIFGSNESSRAIASIISLVHRELMNDPEFALTKIGKVAILSGLTKAMTAFAVLQNVTHRRTMKQMKNAILWKGLVIEEEDTQALLEYKNKPISSDKHSDVIHELEEILSNTTSDVPIDADSKDNRSSLISLSSTSSNLNGKSIDLSLDKDGNPYHMYEITTITNQTTTRTTRIRPIDAYGNQKATTKQVIQTTSEEENESFIAVVDHQPQPPYYQDHKQQIVPFRHNTTAAIADKRDSRTGFKIMLSSVSKKLARKKLERKTTYSSHQENENSEETIEGSIQTSTSTTYQHQQSSSTQYVSCNQTKDNIVSSTNTEDDSSAYSEPETKPKRRKSWSGLKMKQIGKKKSITNLFQKGADSTQNDGKKRRTIKPKASPPIPSPNYNSVYLQPKKNGSLASSSSVAHTFKTLTYSEGTPSIISNTSSRSLIRSPSMPSRMHQNQSSSLLDTEPNRQNFPRRHIVTNIAHFIRYASAAYGESFMRILGIGDIPSVLPNSHHPNHHAFAHHTGVAVEDILLSSYTDTSILSSVTHSKLHALVHYVTVDHNAEAIVLTCRGTLGLSDVLTDLTCDYKEFTLPVDQLPHGDEANGGQKRQYIAHGGMLEAAQLLATQKGKVFEAIKLGLERYPDYGLVLCGHSLGAGVASLLSVLWSEERLHFLSRRMMTNQDKNQSRLLDSFAAASIKRLGCPFVTSELSGLPAGRPIHCYTYGSPCVMSLPLSEYCGQGLVTSVVHSFDIVSSLSLGLLRDFKRIAVSLHEDSHVADEILSRVIGYYQSKKKKEENAEDTGQEKKEEHEEENEQWFWALIKTMRADMRAEKLFPPSTIYLIESVPQLVRHTVSTQTNRREPKHKMAHMVQFSRCDDVQARFSEIVFSRTMFMDHSPNMYEKAIRQLDKGFFGQCC
ncbi:hypothetical protein BD560DRAFT_447920 [Blakeslea trispora]|nr:hypothetical protein BD560DRAFT_447920 [Blakeslea trispora]